MHYKLSPLILTPGQASGFISEVYVTQPDSRKELAAGRVFVIIEVESKSPEDLKIVNFIIENFCDNYYHNDKIFLREKSKTIKIEHIFESALASTNKKLLEFLHSEKIKFTPELINATIGVIFESDIHFASIGNNKALLVYYDKKENSHKIADVINHAKDNKDGKSHINVAKLFSSVISGKIPKNGYFIFSNEALPEYLSSSQLIKIITTLPPISASEQIKKTLTNINNYIPFLGLIIKNTIGIPNDNIAAEQINNTNTKLSPTYIKKTEESTEEVLSAKGFINVSKFKNLLKNLLLNLKGFVFNRKTASPKLLQLKDRIFFKKRSTQFSFSKLKTLATDITSLIVQFCKSINKSTKKALLKNKANNTNTSTLHVKSLESYAKTSNKSRVRSLLKQIPKKFLIINRKILVFALIVVTCISLLIINILNISENNNEVIAERDNTEIINKITQKQNQVEANLLYNNENNAKNILKDIAGLLAKLPKETDAEKAKHENLSIIYSTQLDKIRHAKEIDSAKLITNFSEINAKADPINIILSNSTIYVGDSREKTIYTLDLKNNLATAVLSTKESIDGLKHPIKNENNGDIYYLNNTDNLVKLSPKTDTITTIPINFKGIDFSSIRGGAGFGSRIYYISRINNQIYRFNPSRKGFSSHTTWIKENELDVTKAIDMEIDGHIYVLKANGEILKMLRGKSEDFILDKIEPELKMATKFYVSSELNFIYILDPLQKRLVVFNKDGKFIVQYTSNNFNNLKDFVVDEKNKILYFLDKSSIYKISATHL